MEYITKIKIYYKDTDCGGVVYYANYLAFMEQARTEYLEAKGISLKKLIEEGYQFVVRNVNITYMRPAKYGDTIEIKTELKSIDKIKIVLNNKIFCGKHLLSEAQTTLICINNSFRPAKIPQYVLEKLK